MMTNLGLFQDNSAAHSRDQYEASNVEKLLPESFFSFLLFLRRTICCLVRSILCISEVHDILWGWLTRIVLWFLVMLGSDIAIFRFRLGIALMLLEDCLETVDDCIPVAWPFCTK